MTPTTQSTHPAPHSEGRGCAWVGTFLPSFDKNGDYKTFALVDRADYDALSEYRWHPKKDGYLYRVLSRRTETGPGITRSISLHRHIMGLEYGDQREVDHINRNKRDNRRCNMRITDSAGNKQNIGLRRNNTSGFKGVSYYSAYPDMDLKCRWKARAHHNGKEKSLGYYETAEKAAKVVAEYRKANYACATDR